MNKRLGIALAASALVGLTVAAVWILGPGGDGTSEVGQVRSGREFATLAVTSPESGASVERLGISGVIEYVVRGADGKVKQQGAIRNTTNDPEALNEVFNRITGTASGGAYDGIAALDVPVATDDPSNGVLASSLTLLLDGDSVAAGNQNPTDGAVTTDFGTESGNGTVAVTFTAQGAANVLQIVLTKSIEDDTADGALAIADADIFAFVDVPDVSLAASDTVTYTWTVDVD